MYRNDLRFEAFVFGVVFTVLVVMVLSLWLPSTEVNLCREAGYAIAEELQGEWYCVETTQTGEMQFHHLVSLIEQQ